MVCSPRATLSSVVARPRSLDAAILIVFISSVCSAGFLMTRVGQLAALDQQVRTLESFGAIVTDDRYAQLRSWVPYWPAIAAATIVIGWPLLWVLLAAVIKAVGNVLGGRGLARRNDEQQVARRRVTFAQVLTIVVHASAVLALRSMIAAPVNYARESLGGATSLTMVLPAFGESTLAARVVGAVDIFVVWWVVLVAIGLSILYEMRPLSAAIWLLGAYAAGVLALALTMALRGGM
jgi:hypothetical protein